jgi:ubiquinone/menaquinone biosynthesis C-methylase UbiE
MPGLANLDPTGTDRLRPMSTPELPDSIAGNIADWTRTNEQFTDGRAEAAWAPQEITWGVFGVREDEIGSPLGDVSGLDVVELGCGTAYFSAQLAQRGARPVGVDPTPAQLATARRMQDHTGIRFPLVEAPAERVPLPDASFDLAFSEFGASLWADPQLWIPEAGRLLRPGGRLVFLTNSTISYLCAPDVGGISERLQRPQFGMYRIRWPDQEGTEYHLAHGDWVRLLRGNGFEIEDLIEPPAPPNAQQHDFYDYVTPEWAHQWPAEEIWVARMRM